MDIKNVNEQNIPLILKRLDYLDNIYKFKNILIFETKTTSPKLRLISDAGYHTSYYLPNTGLKAMKKGNKDLEIKEAIRIKNQIESQNLSAVSFRKELYEFIKKNVEPITKKEIVYHTWQKYKFKRKDELLTIQKENYYKDSKVKTIIYSYYNNKFNRLYDF